MSRAVERSKRPISALIGNSTEFPILRQQDVPRSCRHLTVVCRGSAGAGEPRPSRYDGAALMAKAGAGRGSSSLDLCRPDWCQSSGNRIRKEHERGPVHGRVRVELAEGRSGRGNGGRVCLESLPLAGGGRSLWSGRGRGAGDHGCGRCAPGPGRSPHGGDEPSANPRGYAFSRRIRIRAALRPALTWGSSAGGGRSCSASMPSSRWAYFPSTCMRCASTFWPPMVTSGCWPPPAPGFSTSEAKFRGPLSIGWRNVRSKPVASMDAVALVGGAERYEAGSLNVAALIGPRRRSQAPVVSGDRPHQGSCRYANHQVV